MNNTSIFRTESNKIAELIHTLIDIQIKEDKAKPTEIPFEEIKVRIKKDFDQLLENRSDASKNFMIQYTVFEFMGVEDGEESWYMNCTIPGTADEGIYNCDVIESEQMEVQIDSYKGNYKSFVLRASIDYKGASETKQIYASDLYPDFAPKKYTGSISTRGGFTGWNYFNYQIDANPHMPPTSGPENN